MAQMRSHRGYLERLREDTAYLTPQAEALTEPLRQTTEDLGLGDLGDEALYLWNVLFDPRDILDLIKSGRTESEAAARLVAALRGALIGWAIADTGGGGRGQWTMCVIALWGTNPSGGGCAPSGP